jgi:hypothetical protein
LLLVTDGVDAGGELLSSGVEASGGSTEGLIDISSEGLGLVVNVGANEVQELLSGVVLEGVSLSGVSFPTLGLSLNLSNDVCVDGV